MNTTRMKLMVALIAITALAPAPAVATEKTNPYTVKLDNDVCTFGVDQNNPELLVYSQDRGYINQSYVLNKIAKEVPDFAPVWAANPRLENKLDDPKYRANWDKAVIRLKAAGYTDNDIMWIDQVLHKEGMVDRSVANSSYLNKPVSPKKASQWIKVQTKGTMQHYASKMLYYNIDDNGKIELFQYWPRTDKPLPELSEKITDKANGEGHQQLVNRARTFAGYEYDALEECVKLGGFGTETESPQSTAKPTSSSSVPVEPTTVKKSDGPAPSDNMFTQPTPNRKAGGALGVIYRIINSVIGFFAPALSTPLLPE